MFPQVFHSYQSKAQVESTSPAWNSPTHSPHRWTQPLSKLSTSSRSGKASGRQIPKEWQPPGTCRSPHPHQHPEQWDHQEKASALCQHQGAAERTRNVSNSHSQHRGGTSQGRRAFPTQPSLPQGLPTFTKPTLSPPKPAEGQEPTPALLLEVPTPLSPSPWEPAKPGTEGQHRRGSGGCQEQPWLPPCSISLHSGAATDSNNEMAALSTTLNKCHALFLV